MKNTSSPKLIILASATFMSFLIYGSAHASMRCDKGIISEEDSTYEVETKCGPPSYKEVIPAAPGFNRNRQNHAATIENWVYGPKNGAIYQLKFIDGKLVNIDFSRQ